MAKNTKKQAILVAGLDPETIRRLQKDVPSRQMSNFLRGILRQAATLTKDQKLIYIRNEQEAGLQAEK